jgi:hypothetical protein
MIAPLKTPAGELRSPQALCIERIHNAHLRLSGIPGVFFAYLRPRPRVNNSVPVATRIRTHEKTINLPSPPIGISTLAMKTPSKIAIEFQGSLGTQALGDELRRGRK